MGKSTFFDAREIHVAKAAMSSLGVITYTGGALLGDLIQVSVTPDQTSSTHATEHSGKVTRYKTQGANITVNTEPLAQEKRVLLFGRTQDDTTDEVADNIADEAQHVGVAYYKAALDGTITAVFLPYALFNEGTDDVSTELENTTYSTSSTVGYAEADSDGVYRVQKVCADAAAAITWIKGKLSIT